MDVVDLDHPEELKEEHARLLGLVVRPDAGEEAGPRAEQRPAWPCDFVAELPRCLN